MSLDALRDALPAYAKDLSLNLSSLASFLASAHAVGQPNVIRAVEAAAAEGGLSPEAANAAKAASAIMGMNNVYYRALHLVSNPEYRTLPARLRMNVIANPGVDKADFELWSLAVSAVNGCGMCLDSHEAELKTHGVPAAQIQAALRIAAVVNAVSRVLAAEDAIAA
jgi:alkyl hydroperoxide reductase subunit D